MSTPSLGVSLRERLPNVRRWPEGLPRVQRVVTGEPPTPNRVMFSYGLTAISLVLLVLLLNIGLVGHLQHFAAQNRLYNELRLSLAEGSAPIGQVAVTGELVEPGPPIAYLEIPKLGIREVVVEGTTSRITKLAVGHRRDTPMPGQPGASVLMGRKTAYGGVFGHLDKLLPGDTFKITTGQGEVTYEVLGTRVDGSSLELPVQGPDDGRIALTTASGGAFQPGGALRVDALQVSESFPRPPVAFAPGVIDDAEQALAGDRSRLFGLSWLLELLLLLTVATVWAWKRWSHPGTWIVAVPAFLAVGLACADRVCDLLPNLM